ncbi:MAG: VOC family protein [Chromatiales bacterium]
MSDSRNKPVDWFEIYVQDMGRAKVFYESVLGRQFTKLENPGIEPGMEL